MRRAALATLLVLACSELTGDFSDIVAIELLSPRAVTLEEGDSVLLEARALDIDGNVLEEAPVVWETLTPVTDSMPAGIALDSATGLVVATRPGTFAVRARVEELPTEPVTVQVTPAADSLAADVDTALTVDTTATASGPLRVRVLDLTTADSTLRLGGQPVTWQIVAPALDSAAPTVVLTLTAAADPGEDPFRAGATTGPDGTAAVFARRQGAGQPDSVIVEATASRAVGTPVPGSPVRFVVHFAN